ncbi:MAG TPA: Fe-S cluster assembly protein SufD [Candidatus Sulfotelmatobacter sp.]
MMITTTEQLESYLVTFGDFRKQASGRNLGWLRKLREDAFARFCEVGFPTTRDEDWRFTNVAAIAKAEFRLPNASEKLVTAAEIEAHCIAGSVCRLVFVNGQFSPQLSSLGNLPAGVEVNSLGLQIEKDPSSVERHLGRYLNIQRDAFSALNTAFAADGGYVYVARRTVLENPIHLLFVSKGDSSSRSSLMSHPRNLIVAEAESELTLVEDYISLDEDVSFCNTATELVVGDSAVVSHYMLERENRKALNISTLRLQQGRGANVSSHSVLLGGALVRNNVHPVLAGEGGECLINGLFAGTGDQHLDNYMLVEHASPHCASRQFYNGILNDHAHGVFHGRIIVHKDAQKTDAKQTNRNLLLSDDARIDTKPQLEIYADDVKCTHGATIGQIDEGALFYLRSRGIEEASARKLLLGAFADECLDRMKPGPARTQVEALIDQSLSSFLKNPKAAPVPHVAGEREMNWEEVG